MEKAIIVILLSIHIVAGTDKSFPKNFSFGVSTSAYQAEGGWNEDGKGLSKWDYVIHYENPAFSIGNATADVSADTYHHGPDDVKYLTSMGLTHYRFSISWSRILPNGTIDNVNKKGIAYYNKLIDALISANVTPVVTMQHFDLPHDLEANGSFQTNKLTEWFTDYARILFQNFGDRVKYWMTFNEPTVACTSGKATLNGISAYKCGHNLLLAHAGAYRLYEKEFKGVQKGLISIPVNLDYYAPINETSEADKEAARKNFAFKYDWWMNPLVNGDYPKLMKTIVDQNSKNEGLIKSRLPVFTDKEKKLLKGSVDYFALNAYSGFLCTPGGDWEMPSFDGDINTTCTQPDSWKPGIGLWRDTPWTLKDSLLYIKENYNNPPVFIAENGYPDEGKIKDEDRAIFYRGYLSTLLDAILDEGCNVFGYTAWSFMDVYEMSAGYLIKFGLLHVDFDDPARPRTRKYSSYIYENIVKTRKIDYEYSPDLSLNKSVIFYVNVISTMFYVLVCILF